MQREILYAIVFVIILSLSFWYLVAYSFYDAQMDSLDIFTSDGCTLFSDEKILSCCVAHDKAYWLGGDAALRKESDSIFRACVHESTEKTILSDVLYFAVRVGGVPYIKTPWRWGFGWEFGRGYR